MDFVVTSRQMGGQLSAEQFGIAARDKNVQVGSQQAVHKQIPSVYVLYLVKHQIGNVRAVQLIDTREHRVQVFYGHLGQTVVVKVDIAVSDAALQ